MDAILRMLENDAKLTAEQIAGCLGLAKEDVESAIRKYEDEGIILKYTALVDREKIDGEAVKALIELKLTPQGGDGYDRVAKRIYQYDEVESLYLMTGTYDLLVTLSARTMKEAAHFVYKHLATIEGVSATATHFIMKKYKEMNCVFDDKHEQEERMKFI